MKKSRKFLSIILSAAMVCSMFALPVSAAGESENTNSTTEAGTTDDSTSGGVLSAATKGTALTKIPFVKMLQTDDATIMTNTTFTFTMTPDDVPSDKKDSYNYYKGVSLGNNGTVTSSVTAASLSSVQTYYKNDKVEGATPDKVIEGLNQDKVKGIKLTPEFDLSELTFDNPGVYRYKVVEVADQMSSGKTINYDSTEFIVDLYVGKLSVTDKEGKTTEKLCVEYAVSQSKSGTKKPIVFQNTFMTSDIKIEKLIDGSQASADDVFTFWIKIPEGGTSIVLKKDESISAKITEAGKSDLPADIKVGGSMTQEDYDTTKSKENQSADYDPKNTANGWCSFNLKAGQALEITGVPAGMVYYLFEEDYQEAGYDTTYTVTYDAATPAKSVITKIGGDLGKQTTVAGVNHVTILNTKNSNPGTGIAVDVMPYAVIVLLAAACAVLLIFKKRRSAR
jgi:pilin isopeptide linkage protein